jgi:hypothetical protein
LEVREMSGNVGAVGISVGTNKTASYERTRVD